MPEFVTRRLVDAFYEAYASQNTERLAAVLHDDVTWTISGPVDVLAYCGVHRGKAAVVHLVDQIVPKVYRVISVNCESTLIDGDRAATLNRISGRRCADGRVMSYRLAHFLRFRDGKLIENVSIFDSFDAAEQMLGHRLDVNDEVSADSGDLVVV